MSTNINVELFKRYAPKKKIEIINSLSNEELMMVNHFTLTKIIKEAGTAFYKSRDKYLYISNDLRSGNDWNSVVEKVELRKGVCYIDFYVQGDDTDTNISGKFSDFMKLYEYRGRCFFPNRYGDAVPTYFVYYIADKAKVIKSILLQYVCTKYKDALNGGSDEK